MSPNDKMKDDIEWHMRQASPFHKPDLYYQGLKVSISRSSIRFNPNATKKFVADVDVTNQKDLATFKKQPGRVMIGKNHKNNYLLLKVLPDNSQNGLKIQVFAEGEQLSIGIQSPGVIKKFNFPYGVYDLKYDDQKEYLYAELDKKLSD